ncbi:hypothetical protein vBAspALolek_38 [Aeromonas phage vB_AspA_Lolek]|nr:hypothetical protein vBAspALolek_38 [Aeromonas phage vB_AspA_Lolek]
MAFITMVSVYYIANVVAALAIWNTLHTVSTVGWGNDYTA